MTYCQMMETHVFHVIAIRSDPMVLVRQSGVRAHAKKVLPVTNAPNALKDMPARNVKSVLVIRWEQCQVANVKRIVSAK